MCRKFQYLILAIATAFTLAAGQQRQQPPARTTPTPQAPLTNPDIIQLVKSGKPEAVIVATIRSSRTDFDLSSQGCKLLAAAHVSRNILNAMGGPNGAPCASTSASQPQTSSAGPLLGNGNATLLGDGGKQAQLAAAAPSSAGDRVALNPQPLPPRTATNSSSGSSGANVGQKTAAVSDYRQPAGASVAQKTSAVSDYRQPSGAKASSGSPGTPLLKNPGPPGVPGAKNPGPAGASTKAARVPVKLSAAKQSRKIANPKANLQDAAIIAVLKKQRSTADAEAAAMKLSIRPAGQGNLQPSQTMSATATRGATSKTAAMPMSAPSGGTGSTSHPGVTGALPSQFSNLAITCSLDPSMRVLTVSGGPTPAIFTPDPKYNFYTITGCSFGSPGTNSKAYIYYKGTFREDFQIQEWNDNWIKLSLDQNISGIDDQNDVSLVIQNNDGKQWTKNGYRFYAARQTVLLAQIPQSDFSLNHFRPDNSLTQSWKPTYTSGSSASVTPNLAGLSAEVHWDLTADSSGNPVGGNDMYDFGHLHSTFSLDSALLEWKDVSCTDPNYKFTTSKSNWSIDWYGASGLQVSWQGQVCNSSGSCGGGPIVQNDCFAYSPESNYGINVWVTGPRGLDPWSGMSSSK